MRLGTEDPLKAALQGLGLSGRLNTAFIERVNLTVRHGVAALARRTWATSQQASQLLAHLEWWRAYYHGCRVLTTHCEWRFCSHESEMATVWRNAIANVPQPWRPAEPIDDGRQARCSRAPCQRLALECHASLMVAECHVGRPSVKVPAETLGWRLTLGSEGLSRLQNSHKPAPSGFAEGWVMYPPYPMGVPVAARGTMCRRPLGNSTITWSGVRLIRTGGSGRV
jgi:hypothetical protein